jgi:hypothetical protein
MGLRALTSAEMAALACIELGSFRTARNRGTVPAPDFYDERGRARWRAATGRRWARQRRTRNGAVPRRVDTQEKPQQRMTTRWADPVGLVEIAERLGVSPHTSRKWHEHKLMPPPRWKVSGLPCWDWGDIRLWALKTGRLAKAG